MMMTMMMTMMMMMMTMMTMMMIKRMLELTHYRAGDAGLEMVTNTEVRAGAGPRHAVIHPDRDLMFLICELQSYVQVYRYDGGSGGLELLQELELSSTPGDAGAEILVGPTGEFVYASSRGTGVVVVYR